MGDRVNNAFDKDTSFKTLEMVNSWIVAADNKSSILLAFVGLIVGLSGKAYVQFSDCITKGTTVQISLIFFFGLIFLAVLSLTIFHLLSVFTARIKIKDVFSKNLVSFVSVVNMDIKEYISEVKTVDEKKLIEMISSQISINSKIATTKFRHFNKALKFGVLLIPLTIILMIVAG